MGELKCHQENFASLEEKCMEKLCLFRDTNAIVYPLDEELVVRCIKTLNYKNTILGWSKKDSNAALFVKEIKKSELTTTITYVWQQGKEASYTIPFIDDASVENSITSAIICLLRNLRIGVHTNY